MADEGGKRTPVSPPSCGPGRDPSCVLCGCCLEGCPLLAATGREELSPRAKALLAGPSKISGAGQALDEKAVAELAGICLCCGRCETLCPQGVKVPKLIARLRAENPDFRQWLWRQWITRLRPYWPLAATGAGLVPQALAQTLLPQGFGLALKGLRGLKPGTGLRPWLSLTSLPVDAYRTKYGDRPVALFHGCVGSGPRKAWANTAVSLLRGLGVNLLALDFSCCGSTLGVAGLPEDQKIARRANVDLWRGAGRPLLVTYCATCRKGLAEYAGVFADEDEEQAWKAALVPLSALLMGAKGRVGEGKAGRGAPRIVGWHRPCHADGLNGVADADFAFMASLLGVRLRAPRQQRCCGFGGIMQLAAPELSGRVGARCWEGLGAATGSSVEMPPNAETGGVPEVVPAYVLTGCSGCVMQLLATLPAPAAKDARRPAGPGAQAGHWLEVLRLA